MNAGFRRFDLNSNSYVRKLNFVEPPLRFLFNLATKTHVGGYIVIVNYPFFQYLQTNILTLVSRTSSSVAVSSDV